MKNQAFDSSYDHKRAVRLAQRLAGKHHAIQIEPTGRTGVTAPAPIIEAAPKANFGDAGVYRQEVWNELLSWACRQSGSEEAFACDDRGLLIAERGADSEAIEAISSALSDAVARLKPTGYDQPPAMILVRLSDKWLNALVFQNGEGHLVVGMLGARCLQTEELQAMQAIFEQKFKNL